MSIDRPPGPRRRSAAGFVAAALIALAPIAALAEPMYNNCDCVPPENGDCSCEESFNIGPLANHTYRGHCTYFDDLAAVAGADGNIQSWDDPRHENEYTQSLTILDRRNSTACGDNAYDHEFRLQRCINMSMVTDDTVTTRVVCSKRSRQSE